MTDSPDNQAEETPETDPEATPAVSADIWKTPPTAQAGSTETEQTSDTSITTEPESGPTTTADTAPATEPKPANLRWDSLFLLLLICVSLIRLGYLYVVPLDLGPDESYYWDWSRHLDFGYFSKPPMIAWINALSTALLGISAQAVRMPAVVFGAAGLLGMYLCGRRMFNAEVAFWAVAAWLATPGTAALGLIMATDVLLICFWSLALYTLWRTLETEQPKRHWWLLTMLLVGLGSLSKQMMMLFPVLMIIYLLFSEDRKHLKQRWPWLLWLGSLLFLLPPLWWNFRHGWITFKQTAHHIEPIGKNLFDHLKTFGEFVGGQLGLLTPITWLLLLLLCLALLPRLLRWSRQTKFLFIFGAVGLFGFVGLSFKQSINPNWPATFYPAGLLLLAAWGREQVSAGFFDRWRRWFIPGIKLGVVLTLIAYLLPFAMQLSFLSLGTKDPTYRVKGWQELGQQVGETLQQQPRPEQTFILSPLRKYPAEVAFYAPGHPRTYKWPGNPPKVSSQYELWPGPTDKLGWDALILHNADDPLPAGLVAAFENIVDLGERSIPIGAAGERRYHLWRGENLLSWPEWK
ncbi:MAG: phospholipid carrier-dependent glycosyltransferase [Deltaproteobacteria bacterium]|nr:phospholipid carrier-dependent glycosyltransferase [Deltaproteobacteria bacterium]